MLCLISYYFFFTVNSGSEFINSAENPGCLPAQPDHIDRTPRMQLDHNGTFSLIPNSQLPTSLQLSSSQAQTNSSEGSENGLNQKQVTNQQQDIIYQSQDLAQTAARLSGVVGNDMQPVVMDITSAVPQGQLESNQYAVHIRTMNQGSETDSVGPILQIQESSLQVHVCKF